MPEGNIGLETEEAIWLFLGSLFLLGALGLAFAKSGKEQIASLSYMFPGAALFRFNAFRWGVVTILGLAGAVLLLAGVGWLKL